MPAPPIETARLVLRSWRDEDRAPFAAINADPAVMEFLGVPLTRDESDAAIDRMIALDRADESFFMAAERRRDRALIGFIGVKPIGFAGPFGAGHEIGWRLGRAYWGAGLASEGAAAALAHAFATRAPDRILAFTTVANLRSQAVMRRIGMARVAGGDFDHPNLPLGHPLRRHVLFEALRSIVHGR